MKKMDKKHLTLIEFGVVASVGALALPGASTLIGYTKRAKSARIQHDTLGYSDEKIQDLIKEGYIPIATAEDLNYIRYNINRIYAEGTEWETPYTGGLSERYIQVANIDLSEYGGWTPIGTLHANFRGTYDGGNYVITGLEIKSEDNDYQGLFGRTKGATISNVSLENVNVTGANNVGGLVGYAAEKTEISNSYTTGSITGRDYVGGLVGGANNSTIENSYAKGSVSGLAGFSDVGGLVGRAATNTTIINSYATGEVTGLYDVGGLVGYARGGITISNSYWDTETTGQPTSAGGTGKSTDDMKLKDTYEGWDFENVWEINEGKDYPKLR